MLRKVLVLSVITAGSFIIIPEARADGGGPGCTSKLMDCYGRAAQVNNFWDRWAAGLDCELDYLDCARALLIGA